MYPYTYIYIYTTYLYPKCIYLFAGYLPISKKKLLAPFVAPHHLPGKFLQVTAPMVVVMVIKTDKATSPPANKAKRFEADPGSEVRIFDYWINSKSTQNSLITCVVDVFCSVICLLWKPSNGDTMLVFAWYRATRNWTWEALGTTIHRGHVLIYWYLMRWWAFGIDSKCSQGPVVMFTLMQQQ